MGSLHFVTLWSLSTLGSAGVAALLGIPLFGTYFVYFTLLFVYAAAFPQQTFYLFGMIPIHVRVLAFFALAVLVYGVFAGGAANIAAFGGAVIGFAYYLSQRVRIHFVSSARKRPMTAVSRPQNRYDGDSQRRPFRQLQQSLPCAKRGEIERLLSQCDRDVVQGVNICRRRTTSPRTRRLLRSMRRICRMQRALFEAQRPSGGRGASRGTRRTEPRRFLITRPSARRRPCHRHRPYHHPRRAVAVACGAASAVRSGCRRSAVLRSHGWRAVPWARRSRPAPAGGPASEMRRFPGWASRRGRDVAVCGVTCAAGHRTVVSARQASARLPAHALPALAAGAAATARIAAVPAAAAAAVGLVAAVAAGARALAGAPAGGSIRAGAGPGGLLRLPRGLAGALLELAELPLHEAAGSLFQLASPFVVTAVGAARPPFGILVLAACTEDGFG